MELAREDIYFLRSLCRGIFALALSAVVLVALFIASYQFREPKPANSAIDTTILGKQFKTILGTSRIQENALLVTGLEAQEDGNNALITTPLVFDAQNYPYLRYRFDGLQPGVRVQFFWSTAENPEQTFTAVIPSKSGTSSTFNLGAQPAWQGTITDIALFITGDLRAQPLRIPEITFASHSWHAFVASIWSDWTAFRGWSGSSINYLYGTSIQAVAGIVSPTVAMAIWAGLALVFLYLIDCFWLPGNLISYGAAILIPWIALDLLWQSELSAQLQDTKYLFSGNSTHEKHLVDVDQNIYSYANRLKEDVLPSSPSKIFILHNSQGHNFYRLKTQYYLLPHNIYNFNHWQPDQLIQPGDYILALGAVPGLFFDVSKGELRWQDNILTVAVVDQDPLGTLMRVRPAANLPVHPDSQQEEFSG